MTYQVHQITIYGWSCKAVTKVSLPIFEASKIGIKHFGKIPSNLKNCIYKLSWILILNSSLLWSENSYKEFLVLGLVRWKLPLNATVEMGGVNQVTHRVQSVSHFLPCWNCGKITTIISLKGKLFWLAFSWAKMAKIRIQRLVFNKKGNDTQVIIGLESSLWWPP